MAYKIKSVTIRTDNTDNGMKMIYEVWNDITSGKLPLLFDSEHNFQQGISPVSKYENYESDENGAYDLSVIGVKSDFFESIEKEVQMGVYKKYNVAGEDIGKCAKLAWETVWNEQKDGVIQRAFSKDFESTVPAAYTKDGKAHCYLYISIK